MFSYLTVQGTEETAAIHFPHALRGTWQYEFQSAASVNKYCRSNSSMEICRANDTKTMDFDYDKCSTMQAYSGRFNVVPLDVGYSYCAGLCEKFACQCCHAYLTDCRNVVFL
ncbi:hypothetical protein DPMN_107361 [Dreissena polymorpha]|uniref:Uncharacterized protein n=1 Tax=Dreissena polymorpha TaxID=45954 RepID=A0A9D4QJQ9_DREPO|nr:hypothetical protein DPMN_107361 [Dreissena polymorpha]